MFKGRLKGVPRDLYLKDIQRVFKGSFKGVSRVFYPISYGVSNSVAHIGGGLRGLLLDIMERIISDPMLLKSICYLVHLVVTKQKKRQLLFSA